MSVTAQITELIDKFDTYELVRDQIAAILKVEGEQQAELAVDAGKDPQLWKFRVFSERSNPWDMYQDSPPNADRSSQDDRGLPLVNVWLNDVAASLAMGNVIERQQVDGTFNLDCYGYAVSCSDGSFGHIPGDEQAVREAMRTARLVRNILMSGYYVYLGMQGTVGKRWIASITPLQTPSDVMTNHVACVRIALTASFNEFSPQVTGELLELVSAQVRRDTATGEILATADYPIPGV